MSLGILAVTLISKSKPANQFTPTAVQLGYGDWLNTCDFTFIIGQ